MNMLLTTLTFLGFVAAGLGCDNIEVMICTMELEVFGSLVKEDGSPDVDSICGKQEEFGPLADKCESEARACDDDSSIAKVNSARENYQAAVDTNCQVVPDQEVIEEEIFPDLEDNGPCSTVASQFAFCNSRIESGDQVTCQDLEEYNLCVIGATSACNDESLVAKVTNQAASIFQTTYEQLGEEC